MSGLVAARLGLPRYLRHPQEAADPRFDFRSRPAEAQTAGVGEPVRIVSAGAGGVIEVEADRGGRDAAAQQPRPGGEVGQVKEGVGAAEADLP